MHDPIDDYEGYEAEDNDEIEQPTKQAAAANGVAAAPAAEVSPVAEKRRMREKLQADIDAFLRNGGAVQTVEDNYRADPPRKPDIQYGSSPI